MDALSKRNQIINIDDEYIKNDLERNKKIINRKKEEFYNNMKRSKDQYDDDYNKMDRDAYYTNKYIQDPVKDVISYRNVETKP